MAVLRSQPWLLPSIAVLTLFAGVIVSSTRDAETAVTYGPLITDALKYEGQRGGECYLFMQKVVKEVTGRYVNGDYRQSYINAGAVEVPIAQAQSGDIIQLADDKNTAATASYPGLHTALVMDNLGGGAFKVIDSNYFFDGVVRVHDNYSPTVSAARYSNIQVHVWRLPAGKLDTTASAAAASTAKSATATATPAAAETPVVRDEPLEPGTFAVIVADGDCLRIRESAGIAARQVACPPSGAEVRILDGAVEKDGYRWQLIATGATVGWAADMYLQPISGTRTAQSTNAGAVAAAAASDAATASTDDAAPEAEVAAAVTDEPAPPAVPAIIGGEAPPTDGGYALFVFSGGTYEDMLAVTGCAAGTATFWATSADGELLWYLPAVTVEAVNAQWNELFGGDIAPATALMARCV